MQHSADTGNYSGNYVQLLDCPWYRAAANFGGEMRYWVSNELGIPYDQRNALVVGIAMGFAVIPTIFSITEDAIFAVPKHLSLTALWHWVRRHGRPWFAW